MVAPYGYRVEDSQLVGTRRRRRLSELCSRREKGATLQDIADWPNDHGYLSRSGKRFYPSQIRSILSNRKSYEGYYSYSDIGGSKGFMSLFWRWNDD